MLQSLPGLESVIANFSLIDSPTVSYLGSMPIMENKKPQQIAHQLMEQLKRPRPIPRKILFAGIVFFVFFGIYSLYGVNWSGFGESQDQNVLTVQEDTTQGGKKTHKTTKTTTDKLTPGKSLWDWMTLFLAPATLAGLGFLFQSNQEKAKAAKEETEQKREVEQQHHQALQSYLAEISALLVDKQLKTMLPGKNQKQAETGHTSDTTPDIDPGQSVTATSLSIDPTAALQVVKARTLSLLRLFDEDMPRKSNVLSFLGDTELLTELSLDLSSSHWEKANFRRANLRKADLRETYLSKADLSFADLRGAYFNEADLTGADLGRANLNGANLNGAYLTGADLSFANLSGAYLNGANLTGANLNGANLSNARLIKADLSGAELMHVDLSGANLSNAKLSNANLIVANLSGADLSNASLGGAELSGAELSNAKLSNANLSGASLSNAKLNGANLNDADLSNASLINASLSGADLSNANLSNANLGGADLSGADLSGADLSGATFTWTILLKVNLSVTGLTPQQLDTSYLCNVLLPDDIKLDSNRDCEKLPELLLERYPEEFTTVEEVKEYVDRLKSAKIDRQPVI